MLLVIFVDVKSATLKVDSSTLIRNVNLIEKRRYGDFVQNLANLTQQISAGG